MLFVGYHNTCAYKLYCPVTNKVEFSIDVIVKESKAWDWSKSQSNSGVELTYEDTSEYEGSEDESESENDSEGDSEDESDYEGESDFDLDFDGDSDSCGNPGSRNIIDSDLNTPPQV
jgi:hypothetical protein